MAVQASPMRGVPVTIQSGATSGNGTVLAIPDTFKNHTIIVKGSAGVSAGAVRPEIADDPAYSDAWAAIGASPITVVASTEVVATFVGTFPFLRVGISTPIANGTVDVIYKGS